jgi:hypothetical protein
MDAAESNQCGGEQPSTNGANGGREAGTGRFLPGNAGGPGNPFARRTAQLRAVLFEEVSDADLRAIVRAMVQAAKAGDLTAAREVLDRVIGKPAAKADGTDEPGQPMKLYGIGAPVDAV